MLCRQVLVMKSKRSDWKVLPGEVRMGIPWSIWIAWQYSWVDYAVEPGSANEFLRFTGWEGSFGGII
jgi:hypothetical protein